MIEIRPLQPGDRAEWESLFRDYIRFYEREEPQAMYDRAWREFMADQRMHARVAVDGNRVVGIVHFLVHANTSAADVCYLQDLYTVEDMRGRGVGRALIATVVDFARERACARVYWHTKESNATARRLYEKVAEQRGFIRYQIQIVR